jgi:hypothetical protein
MSGRGLIPQLQQSRQNASDFRKGFRRNPLNELHPPCLTINRSDLIDQYKSGRLEPGGKRCPEAPLLRPPDVIGQMNVKDDFAW